MTIASATELAASVFELPPKIGTPIKEMHEAGAVEDTKISKVVRSAAVPVRTNHRSATKHFYDA